MFKQLFVLLIFYLQFEIFPQWQMLNGPYETQEIRYLLKHPNGSLFAAGRGYIGDFDVMIYRSDDSGKTWNKLNQSYSVFNTVYCLAAGPGNEVYAGCSHGKYYFSSDNGNSWSENSLGKSIAIKSIVSDSLGNMFLGGLGTPGGICKSTDHGITWTIVLDQGVEHVNIDNDNNVYAAGSGGIYFSSNSGADWTTRNNGLPLAGCYKIEKNSGGDLFASQETGIYKSTDKGLNWYLLPSAPKQTTWTLYVDKNDFLYVCLWNTGVSRSKNGGNSWELIPLQKPYIYCALVDDENNLYVGAYKALYVYSESDSIWSICALYKGIASVQALAFCSDSTIFASTPVRLWQSINLGLTWFNVNDQVVKLIEKGNNDRIFVASQYSDDCGNSWNNTNLTSLGKICINTANNLYTSPGLSIYKSTNNGTYWDLINYVMTSPSINESVDLAVNSLSHIFWVGRGYIPYPSMSWVSDTYRSTDGGVTFKRIYSDKYVYVIKIDQYDNIFLGTDGAGVLKSTDNGNSWTAVNNGLIGVFYVRDLILSPEGILVAATNNGVYRYSEDFNYWTQLNNEGLTLLKVNRLYYHNNSLYVGTDAGIAHFTGKLPVELMSFSIKYSGSFVELNWTTSTEKNNYGFEIQRKVSSGFFATIGFTNGSGTKTSPTNYSFVDKNTESGKYFYRLKQMDYNGSYEYSNEIEVIITPVKFALHQNYPNPFNPVTKIKYTIPTSPFNPSPYQGEGNREMLVILKVYDVLGREVATLLNEEKSAGSYEVEFNGSNFPSGVYFYQLRAGSILQMRKMILLQ